MAFFKEPSGCIKITLLRSQFRQTQRRRSSEERRKQCRLVVAYRSSRLPGTLLGNSEIIRNFGVGSVPLMSCEQPRHSFVKPIYARIQTPGRFCEFIARWKFLQSFLICLDRRQQIAVEF